MHREDRTLERSASSKCLIAVFSFFAGSDVKHFMHSVQTSSELQLVARLQCYTGKDIRINSIF